MQVQEIVQMIKEERKRRKMSLAALGKLAGYSDCHIWSFERGRIKPNLPMAIDLAEALDFEIEMKRKKG